MTQVPLEAPTPWSHTSGVLVPLPDPDRRSAGEVRAVLQARTRPPGYEGAPRRAAAGGHALPVEYGSRAKRSKNMRLRHRMRVKSAPCGGSSLRQIVAPPGHP